MIVLVLGLVGTACHDRGQAETSGDALARATFSTHQEEVRTDALSVADSPEERRVGLMGVETLDENDGMVFVFDGEQDGSFWMKDTLIPLSIAFWDERGRIVSILDMAPCHEDPCPTYGPADPFVGALEVDQGAFQRDGVQVGDHLTIAESGA